MGAIVHDAGVAFRVWAPKADAVYVTGNFNDWSEDAAAMAPEDGGVWYVNVPGAKSGDEYRFLIRNGDAVLSRIDPYARAVTTSVGNGIVIDPTHDWHGGGFKHERGTSSSSTRCTSAPSTVPTRQRPEPSPTRSRSLDI
jgi:1,4-alpha-glucan branching enzyme